MQETKHKKCQACADSLFAPINEGFFQEATKASDFDIVGVQELQQVALVRMHLFMTGHIHESLANLADQINGKISKEADDGIVPPENMPGIIQEAERLWRITFDDLVRVFYRARYHAVLIAFASLAKAHDHFLEVCKQQIDERALRWFPGQKLFTEASPISIPATIPDQDIIPSIFLPEVSGMLDAAAERTYGDNTRLSARIWRLDRLGSQRINQAIVSTIGTGDSAFNAARLIESELGVGRDCPRWTRGRLYGLTPQERITNKRGLLRSENGGPCATGGVAYNAVRLLRNEIQYIHHDATLRNMRMQPWVQQEKIRLSPQHPKTDVCDAIAAGGPYELGFYQLPIHVHCLCWREAIMISDAEFVSRVRGWLAGDDWPEMDNYELYVINNFPMGFQ